MTWEQKLAALNALCEHTLKMRSPGDWYVCAPIEIVDKNVLIGSFGNGSHPEEAVRNHWEIYTSKLESHQYIVARKYDKSVYVRWNGFMWEDVSYLRNIQ